MSIKKRIGSLFFRLPLQNKISLESHPDCACNTYGLFHYMIEQGMNEKYKIYWCVNDASVYSGVHIKNVKFINYSPRNVFELFQIKYHRATSKALVFSNRMMTRENEKQLLLFLQHGSPIKKLLSYTIDDRCDYAIAPSDYVADIMSRECHISREKLVNLGFPRNDFLFSETKQAKDLIPHSKHDKIIVWMPTFRQHKSDKEEVIKTNCDETDTGLPFIKSPKDFEYVNDILQQNHVILVIKPHPAQRLEHIIHMSLSNIQFIHDEDLRRQDVQLYSFLAVTDALMTDYSSVYFDYLLLNRPIGLTFDDIEEYTKKRGLVVDSPQSILRGEYLYTMQDLAGFIVDVANNRDKSLESREEVKKLTNLYQDNQSGKRVYDFLIEKLEEI